MKMNADLKKKKKITVSNWQALSLSFFLTATV